MTRIVFLLPVVVCAIGCDSIARTDIAVGQGTNRSEKRSDIIADVIRISQETATQFGLYEAERRESDVSFTDAIAGQNPSLWLTVTHDVTPVRVEIVEMYISRPTDRHKQLAESLIHGFNANGLNAKVVYRTPDGHGWFWLFLAVASGAGVTYWWSSRWLACLRSREGMGTDRTTTI